MSKLAGIRRALPGMGTRVLRAVSQRQQRHIGHPLNEPDERNGHREHRAAANEYRGINTPGAQQEQQRRHDSNDQQLPDLYSQVELEQCPGKLRHGQMQLRQNTRKAEAVD